MSSKEEAMAALRAHLAPGEAVTVTGEERELRSYTDEEIVERTMALSMRRTNSEEDVIDLVHWDRENERRVWEQKAREQKAREQKAPELPEGYHIDDCNLHSTEGGFVFLTSGGAKVYGNGAGEIATISHADLQALRAWLGVPAPVAAPEQGSERDGHSKTLKRIAELMECEPEDDDDLVEAVRLLVWEAEGKRAPVAAPEQASKPSFRRVVAEIADMLGDESECVTDRDTGGHRRPLRQESEPDVSQYVSEQPDALKSDDAPQPMTDEEAKKLMHNTPLGDSPALALARAAERRGAEIERHRLRALGVKLPEVKP